MEKLILSHIHDEDRPGGRASQSVRVDVTN